MSDILARLTAIARNPHAAQYLSEQDRAAVRAAVVELTDRLAEERCRHERCDNAAFIDGVCLEGFLADELAEARERLYRIGTLVDPAVCGATVAATEVRWLLTEDLKP